MAIHLVSFRLHRSAAGQTRSHGGPQHGMGRHGLFALFVVSALTFALLVLLATPADGAAVDLGRTLEPAGFPAFEADWITNSARARSPLDARERAHLERQRALVDELARRHLGLGLNGTRRDLDTLQRLVDQRAVGRKQLYELQALGVALGDVCVRELGFEWVAYHDEKGRTRALRRPGSDDLLFPVTMISRRVRAGRSVDVGALFARAVDVASRGNAAVASPSRAMR